MKIFLNDEATEINFETISELVGDKKGIAVAVNGSIIPASKWDSFALKENDQILIVQATQGG